MRMSYPTLLWFAGYSNVSSVVIVILGFICMAIFIALVSMNTDFYGPSQPLLGVEQKNMVKVVNPFFLQLENEGKCLKDGIKFHLSRLCPCKAVVLWGVHINNFHNFILEKGHEMRQKLLCEDISETHQIDPLHQESFQFPNAGDDTVSIPCPASVSSSALGSIPRQRYPVVVLVFVPESSAPACPDEAGDSECSNNIVCLISVVHLKDEYVTQSSHVIQQYIKTAGVPIYSLKPLFVNAPSNSEKQYDKGDGGDLFGETQSELDAEDMPDSGVHDQTQSTIIDDVSPHSSVHHRGTYSSSNESCVKDSGVGDIPEIGSHTSSRAETKRNHSSEVENSLNIRRRRQLSSQHSNQNLIQTRKLQRNGQSEEDSVLQDRVHFERQPSYDKPRLAECVVCQTRKDMCVLLPCRHVCVCYKCFKLLDRCPMCRSPLESYFLFSSDGDDSGSSSEDNDGVNEFTHNLDQPGLDTSVLGRGLNAFL